MIYFKSGLLRLINVCVCNNLLNEVILETTLDWTLALTPLSTASYLVCQNLQESVHGLLNWSRRIGLTLLETLSMNFQ